MNTEAVHDFFNKKDFTCESILNFIERRIDNENVNIQGLTDDFADLFTLLEMEKNELLHNLAWAVFQCRGLDAGEGLTSHIHSNWLTAIAESMRCLAKHGRFEIGTDDGGRFVDGRIVRK